MTRIKPTKVKPNDSAVIILWGDDGNMAHELIKGRNCVGSCIGFDKRQIWEVYPYKRYDSDTEYHGACAYKNIYIRLCPKDFKKIFGEDIVERCMEVRNDD